MGLVTNRARCSPGLKLGSFRAVAGCLCSSQVGVAEPSPHTRAPPSPGLGSMLPPGHLTASSRSSILGPGNPGGPDSRDLRTASGGPHCEGGRMPGSQSKWTQGGGAPRSRPFLQQNKRVSALAGKHGRSDFLPNTPQSWRASGRCSPAFQGGICPPVSTAWEDTAL